MSDTKYEIIYQIEKNKANHIKELFENEYWTNDRTLTDIEKMLGNTDINIGIIDKTNDKIIGYARILTDFTYIALITDVMTHKDYRNKGIGKIIMDAFVNAPQLKGVKQLELYCKDEMVSFYEKWGFEKPNALNFMRYKR